MVGTAAGLDCEVGKTPRGGLDHRTGLIFNIRSPPFVLAHGDKLISQTERPRHYQVKNTPQVSLRSRGAQNNEFDVDEKRSGVCHGV